MIPQTNSAQAVVEQQSSLLDKIVAQQANVASRYKPVLSFVDLMEREKAIDLLVSSVMREGIDYGWVPGTKPSGTPKPGEYVPKPTLFKAGAERACAFFGYVPHFEPIEKIEEWDDKLYGEKLFYYQYRCTLNKDGAPVGEGIGSATTWEAKYRYRKGDRECPACGKTGAIIKGQEQYGGGWLCFLKKDGCGAKFKDGDASIEAQITGRIANPDIADYVNTVQKMAQKRSYVAATLTATGLSGRFTQDMEEMPTADKIKREAEQIDTGGHPIGTQAAADHVARQKINGSAGAAPAAESHSTAPASAPINNPLTTGDTELDALVREFRVKDRFGKLNAFGELKKALKELTGDDAEYYRILGLNGVEKADQFKTAKPAEKALVDMFRWVKTYKAQIPPADDDAEASNG